jgi:hypothetical protein
VAATPSPPVHLAARSEPAVPQWSERDSDTQHLPKLPRLRRPGTFGSVQGFGRSPAVARASPVRNRPARALTTSCGVESGRETRVRGADRARPGALLHRVRPYLEQRRAGAGPNSSASHEASTTAPTSRARGSISRVTRATDTARRPAIFERDAVPEVRRPLAGPYDLSGRPPGQHRERASRARVPLLRRGQPLSC